MIQIKLRGSRIASEKKKKNFFASLAIWGCAIRIATAVCLGLQRLGNQHQKKSFSPTFRAPLGYPAKNPGDPAQNCVFPGFRKTYQTFWPPFTRKTPKDIRTKKFGFGFLCLPERHVLGRHVDSRAGLGPTCASQEWDWRCTGMGAALHKHRAQHCAGTGRHATSRACSVSSQPHNPSIPSPQKCDDHLWWCTLIPLKAK